MEARHKAEDRHKPDDKQKQMEEKRRAERIEVQLSVDMKTKYIYSTASVLNISPTGLFIKTMNPLPEGSEVDIFMHLTNQVKPRHFKGVVRWGSHTSKGSLPPGMGVHLIDPDSKVLKRLANQIRRAPKAL